MNGYCDSWDCNMQTVDDVKKEAVNEYIKAIVEELENLEIHFDNDYFSSNREVMIVKNDAIEIVKQGGVSDDVCEWEKGSSGYVGYPAYYSKCCTTNSNGLEMQTHIIADWKYCPYCGKKIKVVEQMDEEDFRYCHSDGTDEYHDCLDYMECEECPYYYANEDQDGD